MAPQSGTAPALFLSGTDGNDNVTAAYSGGQVTFTVGGNPAGTFPLSEAPDSVVVAGLGGDDTLSAASFPESTSIVLLGGEDDDHLTAGATEDALIDGAGDDVVSAGGGDDAVPNNNGADDLDAGDGDDLFVDNAVCDGDQLDGGAGRDNANWANFGSAISIDMAAGTPGLVGGGGQPSARAAALTSLTGLEDIEGTSVGDMMVGDASDNQLLGRPGADTYHAGDGNDSILANSGTPRPDPDAVIDCGEGFDTAQIDFPANGPDAAPIDCEAVEERDPNSFRPPDTPPDRRTAASAPPPRTTTARRGSTATRRRPGSPRPAPKAGPHPGRRVAGRLRFSRRASAAHFVCRLDRRSRPALRLAPRLHGRRRRPRLPRDRHRCRRQLGSEPGRLQVPGPPALTAAGAEAAVAAGGLAQALDLDRLGRRDRGDHELRDPIPGLDPEGLRRVGVEQQDPDFPAVAGVDQAGAVDEGDPVLAGQARARQDQPGVPVGDLDRDPGPDAPPLSRPEVGGLAGAEVEAGVALVGARGQDRPLDHPLHPQLHGRGI